jgi:hypothetical protein
VSTRCPVPACVQAAIVGRATSRGGAWSVALRAPVDPALWVRLTGRGFTVQQSTPGTVTVSGGGAHQPCMFDASAACPAFHVETLTVRAGLSLRACKYGAVETRLQTRAVPMCRAVADAVVRSASQEALQQRAGRGYLLNLDLRMVLRPCARMSQQRATTLLADYAVAVRPMVFEWLRRALLPSAAPVWMDAVSNRGAPVGSLTSRDASDNVAVFVSGACVSPGEDALVPWHLMVCAPKGELATRESLLLDGGCKDRT